MVALQNSAPRANCASAKTSHRCLGVKRPGVSLLGGESVLPPPVAGHVRDRDAPAMPRAAPNIARISKTNVDAAKPRAKRYVLCDDKLKGFGVQISPKGVKTYLARYRAGGGRSGPITPFTVGRHGTITADQARTDAGKILADATRGLDPQADRAKKRADMTVTQLCDLYVAEGCGTKKPATLATDKSRSSSLSRAWGPT